VRPGETCTEEQAEGWLLNYLEDTISKLNKLPFNKPLNQNQFDVLCSFIYNLGFFALLESQLYQKALIDPDDETIWKYDKDNPARTCEFTKWCYAGGKLNRGLLNRRMKEADLYNS
jgi:lysozyme